MQANELSIRAAGRAFPVRALMVANLLPNKGLLPFLRILGNQIAKP